MNRFKFAVLAVMVAAVIGCVTDAPIRRGAQGAAVGAGIGYAAGRSGQSAAIGAGVGGAVGILGGIAEEIFSPARATPVVGQSVAPAAGGLFQPFSCDSLPSAAEREACKRGQADAEERERRAAEDRAYEMGRWGWGFRRR